MDNFYLKPPRYKRVCRKMNYISALNKRIKIFSIGKSVLNRKIYAFGFDNLKNAVLFTGAIHAQEWITCCLLLKFIEDIAMANKFAGVCLKDVFYLRGLVVVPLSNPDGVEITLGGAEISGEFS